MDSQDLIQMLQQNKGALVRLMQSQEGRQMVAALERQGGREQLHAAAQKAMTGSTGDLAAMVQGLLSHQEGAALAEKLQQTLGK